MKISTFVKSKVTLEDLAAGEVFRFPEDTDDEAFLVTNAVTYVSLVNGVAYATYTKSNFPVIVYPDAEVRLGNGVE